MPSKPSPAFMSPAFSPLKRPRAVLEKKTVRCAFDLFCVHLHFLPAPCPQLHVYQCLHLCARRETAKNFSSQLRQGLYQAVGSDGAWGRVGLGAGVGGSGWEPPSPLVRAKKSLALLMTPARSAGGEGERCEQPSPQPRSIAPEPYLGKEASGSAGCSGGAGRDEIKGHVGDGTGLESPHEPRIRAPSPVTPPGKPELDAAGNCAAGHADGGGRSGEGMRGAGVRVRLASGRVVVLDEDLFDFSKAARTGIGPDAPASEESVLSESCDSQDDDWGEESGVDGEEGGGRRKEGLGGGWGDQGETARAIRWEVREAQRQSRVGRGRGRGGGRARQDKERDAMWRLLEASPADVLRVEALKHEPPFWMAIAVLGADRPLLRRKREAARVLLCMEREYWARELQAVRTKLQAALLEYDKEMLVQVVACVRAHAFAN